MRRCLALLLPALLACGSPPPAPLPSPAAVRPGVVREQGSPATPPATRLGPAETTPTPRPERSTPRRDAADPKVELVAANQEVRAKAPLRPDFLEVQIHGEWAFASVAEQGPDGEWDSAVRGLLRRKPEGWRLVTWSDPSEWQPWRKQMSPQIRAALDLWMGE